MLKRPYTCSCFFEACGVPLRSEAGDLARELEGVPDRLACLLRGTTISTTGNDLRRFEVDNVVLSALTGCDASLLLLSLLFGGPKNLLTNLNIIDVVSESRKRALSRVDGLCAE